MKTASMKKSLSTVEKKYLEKSGEEAIYAPAEKIKTIIVEHFPALGKLAALRFVEWLQKNSGWTVSLPTGKTPEHFIKWVTYLLNNWNSAPVRKILEESGIDPAAKPDMRSFHFIQIDEFYPINSWQHNSFYYYVNKYYIDGFGLDPQKAMLINPNTIGLQEDMKLESIWPENKVDLSLRTRYPKNELEEKQKRVLGAIDQWCTDYEARIRKLGGIGFFLGGIGPDGHIGFNVKGSDHYSTTRLTETNYETQAAAATDLGGIEVSRHRLVITIGLQTIVFSPETTAIIIAAGEAKAKIVREAIESEKNNEIPASILQELENSAFYLTQGAAKLLTERRHKMFANLEKLNEDHQLQIVTDCSLALNRRAVDLTKKDFNLTKTGKLLTARVPNNLEAYLRQVEDHFKSKIFEGLVSVKNQVFLHTAPHHDDIMLGYLPYLVRLMREPTNTHFFNYLTSGFTAVTNSFMLKQNTNAERFFNLPEFKALLEDDYFDPANLVYRNRDVLQFLDGLAADSREEMNEGAARRYIRNLVEIFNEGSEEELRNRLQMLFTYFRTQYPGKKDGPEIQRLKGMLREWEADVLWGYFGFGTESVVHSRLGFYQGDIFTEEPEKERDILPVLETIRKTNPTIITVALDPEGSGPDTHYKVLQAISSALKMYVSESGRNDIKVWGYRNVWYRFHPCEANLFVPVTFNGMAILQNAFLNSFVSQADASFPSYEYDGPFSNLAKKIHVEQYRYMKTLLGRDFFYRNPDSRIRSARGFVFLKVMDLDEFHERSRELRKSTENL